MLADVAELPPVPSYPNCYYPTPEPTNQVSVSRHCHALLLNLAYNICLMSHVHTDSGAKVHMPIVNWTPALRACCASLNETQLMNCAHVCKVRTHSGCEDEQM